MKLLLLLLVPVLAVAQGWQTKGRLIVDAAGQPVRIAGVNWFGFETTTYAPHGLWTRGYKDMMDQMKTLGYNTIRLPFCNQLFDADSKPNGIDFSKNSDLQGLSGIEIMDRVVSYAGKIGMKILLDRHRPDAGGQSALWYTSQYKEERWIEDWTMLAARYKGDRAVIGADLHNEPRGAACWGCGTLELDWRLAAQRAGNAILAVNPNWLIVVEGVEYHGNTGYWWGGNLKGVAAFPVLLDVPNRLVYSAHDYPSSIYAQTWFSSPDYPANLSAVWDAHWGYISKKDIAPVLMGEFGTRLESEADKLWFDALVKYISPRVDGIHWLFWSWNPNSGDTLGILLDDWTSVNDKKQAKLSGIQFPIGAVAAVAPPTPLDPTPAPVVTPPPTVPVPTPIPSPAAPKAICTATYKLWSDWGTGFSGEVSITNNTAGSIDGWEVAWSYGGSQKIIEMWNGRHQQADSMVSVKDIGWNAKLPEKSSILFGFIGGYSGTNPAPETYKLNGFTCELVIR